MTFTTYQLYGERCSGTHYIRKLLELNVTSATFTEAFGFKHWFVDPNTEIPSQCLVFVIARNPLRWAQSFHRLPWHCAPWLEKLSFADFIRHSWAGGAGIGDTWREHRGERDPRTGERFATIFALRRAKLAHWLNLQSSSTTVCCINYDIANRHPQAFLSQLSTNFGLSIRSELQRVHTYKGLATRHYEPRAYPALAPDDVAFIQQQLDPRIETQWSQFLWQNESLDMLRSSNPQPLYVEVPAFAFAL